MRLFDLVETEEMKNNNRWDSKLSICIKGQKGLQAGQLFAMERMYKNWSDWRVRLAVWLIRKTKL